MRTDTGTLQDDSHEIRTFCCAVVPPSNENPAALAGATGADFKDCLSWIGHSQQREFAARGLKAVLACDPRDRIPLMEPCIDPDECPAPSRKMIRSGELLSGQKLPPQSAAAACHGKPDERLASVPVQGHADT